MPAGAAADVGDLTTADLTEVLGQVTFFNGDERVIFYVIDGRPLIVAFLRGDDFCRSWWSWWGGFHGAGTLPETTGSEKLSARALRSGQWGREDLLVEGGSLRGVRELG